MTMLTKHMTITGMNKHDVFDDYYTLSLRRLLKLEDMGRAWWATTMKQAQTRPDMVQTTCLASFGPLVRVLLIICVLYIPTNYTQVLSTIR